MPAPTWIIVHSDGSMTSSENYSWEEAPGYDCQAVLFRDPQNGWTIRHQADYYYLNQEGAIIGMTGLDSLLDYVINVLGVVKQGRMLSKAQWEMVFQQAKRLRSQLAGRD